MLVIAMIGIKGQGPSAVAPGISEKDKRANFEDSIFNVSSKSQ